MFIEKQNAMFTLSASCVILVFVLALALASPADHEPGHDHDHDHDHTHAPTLPGKCPDFPPISSLDISKLSGDWFGTNCLIHGFDDDHDHVVKCVKVTIATQSDGGFTTNFSMNRDGHDIKKKWIAKLLSGKTAQFSADKDPKENDGKEHTITILDTNNTEYLITVWCVTGADTHGYSFQVFSRTKELSSANLEKAKAILKKMNITVNLEPVQQTC